MFAKWLPWKRIARGMARAHGLLDPVSLLARVERFAQPSEVAAPLELIRAGLVFHARGLINTKVIQHNLDWVWPYWVQRQFDPTDESFLPRAFSLTHTNLTHRNWTAVGLPGCHAMPLVDPRGLLTPLFDGWSLDAWVLMDDGRVLLPSQAREALQRLDMPEAGPAVRTRVLAGGLVLSARAWAESIEGSPAVCGHWRAEADGSGWLAVVVRPFNAEGVSFVHDIRLHDHDRAWEIAETGQVILDRPPKRHVTSHYGTGDVAQALLDRRDTPRARCRTGLATAAALYRMDGKPVEVTARVPLSCQRPPDSPHRPERIESWQHALAGACRLSVPDDRIQYLYDAAMRTMVLLSPADVYPGPFTYKRFWFRDAALMLHAMLMVNLPGRAERALRGFAPRQRVDGYFHSQEGEWDSNGQALWIYRRFCELTGRPAAEAWKKPIRRGAAWIGRKRIRGHAEALHDGLLPAGFSAEHLGNNDYYYWDDFWSVAGLRAAAAFCRDWQDTQRAGRFDCEAEDLMEAIERSWQRSRPRRAHDGWEEALPASPYRRMDAGAVGSLAVAYPLGLWGPDDGRPLETVRYLRRTCFVHGGFFQEMIHSGVNAYLTLHIAQVLLRAGRPCFDLVQAVAELATDTGQWPEAIHPRTCGGCMGDGQHGWAAAEWAAMIRNLFVLETADGLALGPGLPEHWTRPGQTLKLGPTLTPYGAVTVTAMCEADAAEVRWDASWRRTPRLELRVPGFEPAEAPPDAGRIRLRRRAGEGGL
jgi:hypothetical protein